MPSSAGPSNRSCGPFKLLALDTSTERLAVAVQGPEGAALAVVEGGAQASARLLPQVAALLAQAGVGYADLDFVAFGRGPGAFTGLRTACSAAQGIAFARGLPVLPLDSLLIVAEDARVQQIALHTAQHGTLDIAVAMDARMDEVYAGVYRYQAAAWHTVQQPGLYSLPGLHEAWADINVQAVAGSALSAFGDRLSLPSGAERIAVETDRAAALLSLAVQAAADGAGVDAALALPLYLRDKVAQTTAERAALKAAATAP